MEHALIAVIIILHYMNIMENVMKIVQMDFYMMNLIIINVNVN